MIIWGSNPISGADGEVEDVKTHFSNVISKIDLLV